MRGGEVLDGFRIFDNPNGLITVGYEDGSLWFPFWMANRSASPPAFLHAIRTAGLRVLGGTAFVADPTGPRGVPLLCGD